MILINYCKPDETSNMILFGKTDPRLFINYILCYEYLIGEKDSGGIKTGYLTAG